MKLEPPINANYCATVVRVKTLVDLPNADRLKGLPLFGLQAIVGLNTEVGELGILFPAEVQLSVGYACSNNLMRHSELNDDKTAVGYLEDNRRVRALRLRGSRSDALFMPLSSLNDLISIKSVAMLTEGDQFDAIDGVEICRKYVRRVRHHDGFSGNLKKRKDPRVDPRQFPEHFDSLQYLRICDGIPDDTQFIVTQKLHGTSIRVGNVQVTRPLTWIEKIAKWFGARVELTEFASVYGSRKVIKDSNNPLQDHYYDSDLWSNEGKKLDGLIPESYIVYGELIGYTEGGAPIQTHYTYDCLPGTRKLFVYRVTHVNPTGFAVDLSWDGIQQFCLAAGLTHVPFLWSGRKSDFRPEHWLDRNFHKALYLNAIPLAADSPCDEGVCIRIEGLVPQIYKHKSPLFLAHETAMLDAEVEDIEADLIVDEADEAGEAGIG